MIMDTRNPPPRWLATAVFFSGATALTYQFLWLKSFSLIFGGTTRAASIVMAVFMAGLAIGGHLCRRFHFGGVLKAYALAELGIGLGALAALPILNTLTTWPGHPLLKAMAALVILPTTILSGASIPLALEYVTRQRSDLRSQFSRLYRLNTQGAAAGLALSAYILVPALGQTRSTIAASLINLSIAALAWTAGNSGLKISLSAPVQRQTGPGNTGNFPWMLVAFGTGAMGLGLEILWMRTLCLLVGSTVYAFTIMLLAVLLGLSLGTWLYGKSSGKVQEPRKTLTKALVYLGCSILAQLLFMGFLPSLWYSCLTGLPGSFGAGQAAGLGFCFLALLPVTALQGFCFPLLAHLHEKGDAAGEAQAFSGALFGWNAWGAALGSLGTGILLIPAAGLQAGYVMMAAIPLLMGNWLWLRDRRPGSVWKMATWPLLAAGLASGFVYLRPWNENVMSSGVYQYGRNQAAANFSGGQYKAWLESRVLYYKEGRESLVTVSESAEGRFLRLDGRPESSSSGEKSTLKLLGHLPFLASPAARRALVIGWGSGATAGSASLHGLGRLECAESEPAVTDAAPFFTDLNFGLRPGPHFGLFAEDGRNFLLQAGQPYDVIISQPSHPSVRGQSSLFSREFYGLVKSRLNPHGSFCQWFQYYPMAKEDLLRQFRTFGEVFPFVSLWMVPAVEGAAPMNLDIVMLGSFKPQNLGSEGARNLLADPRVARDLGMAGSGTPELLMANYLTDRPGILAVSGPGTFNTDDRPLLEFSAPRVQALGAAEAETLNRDNHAILDELSADPEAWKRGPWAAVAEGRDGDALFEWGKLSVRRGLQRRAEKIFQRVLTKQPRRSEAWLLLGKAQAALGENLASEKSWLEALRLQPDLKEALGQLGGYYYRQGDYPRSAGYFAKIALYHPDDAEAFFSLGLAKAKSGDLATARQAMETCLKLNPRFTQAREILDQLGR